MLFENITPPNPIDAEIMRSLLTQRRQLKAKLRKKMHIEDERDARTELRQTEEVIEEEATRINRRATEAMNLYVSKIRTLNPEPTNEIKKQKA